MFDALALWVDAGARSGPENMAVDEWLSETAGGPVLRVYGWEGAWGSFGYAGSLAEAQVRFHGLSWVRRPTGGGVVDHRSDWTYTLFVPAEHPLALRRGPWAYQAIHEALAAALRHEGLHPLPSRGASCAASPDCFSHAVEHDLVDGEGVKLAGAGQRRTRQGLLHQGSVALRCDGEASQRRAEALAGALAVRVEMVAPVPSAERVARAIAARYGNSEWTRSRNRG